jgi:hypothetical protein
MRLIKYILFCLFILNSFQIQSQILYVKGITTDAENQKPLTFVNINNTTVSDGKGNYFIKLSNQEKTISFSSMGYKTVTRNLSYSKDTMVLNISLTKKTNELPEVGITAHKVDTVFGTWKFSVADYEFIDDKLLLLTFEKNLEHAKVMLADASQHILSSFQLPDEAERLYKDYLGYINVICVNHIYRITIKDNAIHVASLPYDDYKKLIMPCIDTIAKDIYFSNYQKDYPQFTYYAYNTADSTVLPFKTVCDKEVLKGYNMEYYFLKPKDKLFAIRLAQECGVDKHRVAATMSGLTTSVFFTPLYAPLFIIKDTVFVFDHYNDAIFKYDKKHRLLDSIHIDYHHPKNWRDWKHEVIVDNESGKAYAVYQKNGFYCLNQIDLNSGKIISTFKLYYKYAEKIKIKNNHVYYVYRPFESLQEKFIYKERISN